MNRKDEELFENIDIFTKTGQLTPPTYIKLFKYVVLITMYFFIFILLIFFCFVGFCVNSQDF